MEHITISRDDNLYEAFADVAKTSNGTLIVTYRESLRHGPYPFSRIVVRRSHDEGRTWSPKQTVIERTEEQQKAGEGRLNCSRIMSSLDGTLYLTVDLLYKEETVPNPGMILLFRSTDDGASWAGPQETGITSGIVPSIKQLSSGDLLIGVSKADCPTGERFKLTEQQMVFRSRDLGKTWEGPSMIPLPTSATANGRPWRLNEGDFAELDDGTVICYMREDGEGLSGWKSLSSDGGRTWTSPIRTQMGACLGRPSVGRLRSGEIAITYRYATGVSNSLALHVETPVEASRTNLVHPDQWAEDFHQARTSFIDNDRAVCPDGGYSGWVQLESGDLFVVNYVTDDAPRAQIRGYLVSRSDWYLYPEGDIWWYHPQDDGKYIETARLHSQAQHKLAWKNRGKAVPTSK